MILKAKRLVSLFLIITILGVSSGCWGKIELDELGIIVAMGIDREKEGFTMTLHIIKPQEEGGEQGSDMGKIWVGTSSGQTLMDASKNFRARVPAQLTWMHNTVIVIGEETARDGLDDIVDFLVRNVEIHPGNWVIISQGRAMDALQVTPEFESTLSEEIEGLIGNQEEWSKEITTTLKDFMVNLVNPFTDTLASRMILLDPEVMSSQAEETDEMTQATIQNAVILDGASVFKGTKLKGWLTKTETRGVLFMKGKASEALMVVPYKDGNISIEVGGVNTEITPTFRDGKPVALVEIEGSARLAETSTNLELTELDEFQRIEKLTNHKIAGEIYASIDKFRGEYNADVLGVGNLYFRMQPKWWLKNKDKWYEEIYPDLEFDIRVDIRIDNTGLILNPPLGGE